MKMPAKIEKWGTGILGVVSLLLVAHLASQLRPTHPRTQQPARGHNAAKAHAGRGESRPSTDLSKYDPTLNLDALRELNARPLPDAKRSLFSFVEPPPPPSPPPSPLLTQTQAQAEAPPPPPPPPPPPIQMKIMGYNEMPGRERHAFASYQDQLQVIQEGDVVGSRYKILRITPMAVLVEDATSHQTTQLPVPQ